MIREEWGCGTCGQRTDDVGVAAACKVAGEGRDDR